MHFSRKTLAYFVDVATSPVGISHSELSTLFYKYNLEEFDIKGNREYRWINFIRGIENKEDADKIIIEILEKYLPRMTFAGEYEALINSLKLDGFLWKKDDSETLFEKEGHLIPTTPTPAALAPEISALEDNFIGLQMHTARTHYSQAVENFTKGNWESCNGQLRSFMEDFFIQIGEKLTGSLRNDPVASLQDLMSKTFLDIAEFQQFKSFFLGIQDNGPHRGLSSEQEALFRLHMSTAIARYLIFKMGAQN